MAGSDRPLARDEAVFRGLFAERAPLYEEAADARTSDVEGAVLAAAGIELAEGAVDRLGATVPETGPSRSSRTRPSRASTALVHGSAR